MVNCQFCGEPTGFMFLLLHTCRMREEIIAWRHGGWAACRTCRIMVELEMWERLENRISDTIMLRQMGRGVSVREQIVLSNIQARRAVKCFKSGHLGNDRTSIGILSIKTKNPQPRVQREKDKR